MKLSHPPIASPKKGEPGDYADPNAEKKSNEPPDLSILNAWYNTAKEAARKKHWEMFVIDQFLRGNHNVRGNPNDNSIEVGRRNDSISYPVNMLYAAFRAVRGYVTRNKPFIEVDAGDGTPEAKAYARRANRVLERDNQLNNFRKINKEWVYYGAKYGVGYRQVGYDPAKKCAIRWTIDPVDLLLGAGTGEMEDRPYLIKTVVRTVGYLKNKYPDKSSEIVPDNFLADDEYKRISLEMTYQEANNAGSNPTPEQTAIVYEGWYRLFKPNSKDGLINKCTFTKNCLLDFAETPYTEYPFIPYKSDVVPNEAWAEGHVKHGISPQRMLNLLNTHMLEYNHIVNRGRFLLDKNSGFKVINSKEGQMIFRNAGKRVEVLNPPSVNPMLDRQHSFAFDAIQRIMGWSDASQGTTPARVSSGDAIEALQQGDTNNVSDLRDNFEDALSLEATWILKMYSLFEADGIVLNHQGPDGSNEYFAAVGQQALQQTGKTYDKYYMEDNGDYCDVCTILPDNHVKVSIASELGETKQARTQLLRDLYKDGIIPAKLVLENLEFPNVSNILERLAEEALADMQMQAMQAAAMPSPPGQAGLGAPPPGPPPGGMP